MLWLPCSSGNCDFDFGGFQRFFDVVAVGIGALDGAGDTAAEAYFSEGPGALRAGAVQRAVPGFEVARRLVGAEVDIAESRGLGDDLTAVLGAVDSQRLRP